MLLRYRSEFDKGMLSSYTIIPSSMTYILGHGTRASEVSRSFLTDSNDVNRRVDLPSGMRVTPSDLVDHRCTHWFRGPCCFCAYGISDSYTECVIDVLRLGKYTGEYVAMCGFDSCGYCSKVVLRYIIRFLILTLHFM